MANCHSEPKLNYPFAMVRINPFVMVRFYFLHCYGKILFFPPPTSIVMVRFYFLPLLWIFKIFKILKFLQQWFENFRNYGKNFGKMATRDNGHFSIAMVRIILHCFCKILFSPFAMVRL